MEKIVPRWEWRTFSEKLDKEINKLDSYKKVNFKKSSEIYIISKKSDDNTKVRDQLMDIKTPIRINSDKFEQWTVLLKSGFPIHINDIALVYKAFNIELPYLEKDQYDYNQYISDIISKERDLLIVDVKKERHIFIIEDAIVEYAFVKFDDKSYQTVAVEHSDPKVVKRVVKLLNFENYSNINYIKAIKNSKNM